jgi:hypothetical protein
MNLLSPPAALSAAAACRKKNYSSEKGAKGGMEGRDGRGWWKGGREGRVLV